MQGRGRAQGGWLDERTCWKPIGRLSPVRCAFFGRPCQSTSKNRRIPGGGGGVFDVVCVSFEIDDLPRRKPTFRSHSATACSS